MRRLALALLLVLAMSVGSSSAAAPERGSAPVVKKPCKLVTKVVRGKRVKVRVCPKAKTKCKFVTRRIKGKKKRVRVCAQAAKTTSKPPPYRADVSVRLDASRAGTQTVGVAGGSARAVAADGTAFTLALPPGALGSDATITVTPVAALSGLHLSGGLLGAVQIEPDGMRLLEPATLTIELPGSPSLLGLTGLAYRGNGRELHLYPLEITGTAVSFKLLHFSGYAVGRANPADAASIAASLRAEWSRALVSANLALGGNLGQLELAIHQFWTWKSVVEARTASGVLGAELQELTTRMQQAFREAVDVALTRCVRDHDLAHALQVERLVNVAGSLGLLLILPSTSRLEDCFRFELDFELVETQNWPGRTRPWVHHVRVHGVPLRPGITGAPQATVTKPLEVVSAQLGVEPVPGPEQVACRYTDTGILHLQSFSVSRFELDRKPALTQPTVSLRMFPGELGRNWDRTCQIPGQGETTVHETSAGWIFAGFAQLHEAEADPCCEAFLIRDWSVLGGSVWARKTYVHTYTWANDVTVSQQTTLDLRHTPSA